MPSLLSVALLGSERTVTPNGLDASSHTAYRVASRPFVKRSNDRGNHLCLLLNPHLRNDSSVALTYSPVIENRQPLAVP